MLIDFLKLAFENLKHRGIRSWLTMLGIFIGIAAVVALISLGNALQNGVTAQFTTLGPDRLIVENTQTGFGPPGSTAVRKLTSHDLDLIKTVPGVEMTVPRLIRSIQVGYNKVTKFTYATDLPNQADEAKLVYSTLGLQLQSGRLLNYNDRGEVLLGNNFANSNYFGKAIKVGDSVLIQGKSFKVVGILGPSGSFIYNSLAIIPVADLKNILNIGDEIDTIAVKVKSSDMTEQVATAIEDKLRKDRNEKIGKEDFTVQTPVQALSTVNTILNIINIIVVSIAGISLFVGGIGIANTMYTSVLERRKEIGVLKSVGAKNKDILLIFLFESSLLGLAGGLVGIIIGLGFAFLISAITHAISPSLALDVAISSSLLIYSLGFSLIVGAISGIVPAFQASKLKPVDALRQ